MYCQYYQAKVPKATCWLFVATLRSFEHVAFDRTLDTQNSIFEFFVPQVMEPFFLELMKTFEQHGLISDLQNKPNRYKDEPSR